MRIYLYTIELLQFNKQKLAAKVTVMSSTSGVCLNLEWIVLNLKSCWLLFFLNPPRCSEWNSEKSAEYGPRAWSGMCVWTVIVRGLCACSLLGPISSCSSVLSVYGGQLSLHSLNLQCCPLLAGRIKTRAISLIGKASIKVALFKRLPTSAKKKQVRKSYVFLVIISIGNFAVVL